MLFFTEMWERFSFYGMRALLTLYMTIQLFEHLQDPEKKVAAFGIYAAYGALVYATPFIGGIIADKFLGYKKSVLFGSVFMAIGHFVMAVENEFWLYIALSFLIIGNGFFKPNISSMVGGLYAPGDSRRDGGFTIFYMGINLGAMLSPLLCGYLGERYGWHWGFGLAGVGMLLGLLVFGNGQKKLENNGEPPNPELLAKKIGGLLSIEHFIYMCTLASVIVFAVLVRHYELMSYVLTPFAIGIVLLLLVKALRSDAIVRDRLLVILILLFFTTLFWSFFEQAGSSITLFTNENVDRSILGISIPASLFQSVNPFFILILAPLFSYTWTRLSANNLEPSTPLKFAIGLFLLGLGFVGFYAGNNFISFNEITLGNGTGLSVAKAATVPLFFLLQGYLLHTMGELCLSPIGLSMVTKLSPKSNLAMVMGAWFLSSAMAHHVAGAIAQMTAEPEYESPIACANETVGSDVGHEDLYAFFSEVQDSILYTPSISVSDTVRLYSVVDAVREEHSGMPSISSAKLREASRVLVQKLHHNCEMLVQDVEEGGFIPKSDLEHASMQEKLSLMNLLQYNRVFLSLGMVAIVSSLLLLAMVPLIRKLMHGVN